MRLFESVLLIRIGWDPEFFFLLDTDQAKIMPDPDFLAVFQIQAQLFEEKTFSIILQI